MGTAPRWPSGGMKHLKLGPFVNSWQEAENTYWGKTISLAEYLPARIYKKLTSENIFIQPTKIYVDDWSDERPKATADLFCSYNQDMGVVTFNTSSSATSEDLYGIFGIYVHVFY
ncbi:MAG: hypothetical protein DBX91_10365 [Subdoligranulum variabile]|nr:MAG: hypothetical protein DBX91_10365 [Subdoligranulum variabile]